MELYDERVKQFGKRKADRKFKLDVLQLFRPSIIKPVDGTYRLTNYGMFKNNLKIGWRNLLKHKGFFAINTGGLAIGIATCLVIMLFVVNELSYDRYNENADQIVRVVLKGEVQGEAIKEAVIPAAAAAAFQREFPEVLKGTRLKTTGIPQITYQSNTFRESRFAYVDPNFFSVFSLPFLKGDARTALKEPYSIVITEREAMKYFGNEDPLGKTLDFKEWKQQYKVTGVIEEVPSNSHFHFDLFGSMEGLQDSKRLTWLEGGYSSYLMLDKSSRYQDLQKKLPALVRKYMGPQLQQAMGVSMAEFESKGNKIGLFLQPLVKVHLYSDFADSSELESGGDINSVYIFSAIALFVLLVACVNFINLSTAAATKRAKEVGIKKVLGSGRNQLITQFLIESSLATLSAMLLAPVLVVMSLPLFNTLSHRVFRVSDFLTLEVSLYYVLFGILISLLAGIYPAFVLSSYKPLAALKSKFAHARGKGIRGGLVIFQFSISVVLIVATIIVDQQMSFIQKKDIGYDKDQMVVVKDSWLLGGNQAVYKEQLLNHSQVENVTRSRYIPAGPSNNSMTGIFLSPESTDFRRTAVYYIDDQYIPTMDMKIMAGRNFSENYGSESSNVIVNETFAEVFGLGDNAVGKTIKASIDNEGGKANMIVIGVIKDFHFKPLHQAIEPLIMMTGSDAGLIIRAKTSDMPQLITDMEKMWNDFNLDEPFSYALLDQLYNQTYLKEQNIGTLLRIFAMLTILVACLGLFGLVTFSAEQRVKEIGIRKVLGSNVTQIISMLSIDYLRLVLISLVIALPIGYYLMKTWLQDFAYRVEMQSWIFALAGISTLLIALLTISFKSTQVAMANPIDSLKDE